MNAAGKIKTANHIEYIYLSYGTDKENLVGDQEIHSKGWLESDAKESVDVMSKSLSTSQEHARQFVRNS